MDVTVSPPAPNAGPAVPDEAWPVPEAPASVSPPEFLAAIWRSVVDSVRCYA